MIRSLVRRCFSWAAAVMALGTCGLSAAQAQTSSTPSTSDAGSASGAAYAVAFMCSVLILLVVCKPSRKQF
jgi:hypothetical protein